MKPFEIRWTAFAVRALDEIRIYLETESGSENIARRYISKIIDRTEQLRSFPESGEAEPLLYSQKQNSRYLTEGNYKIIYQLDRSGIIITDVFHTKQNPAKIIKRSGKK